MSQRIKRADLVAEDKVVVEFFSKNTVKGVDDFIVERENKVGTAMKPHKDLLNAFLKFIPHLMFKCQLADVDTFSDEFFDGHLFLQDERFAGITVTGIVMVGTELDTIKILGRKTTEHGEVIALNSPNIKLGDDFKELYPLVDRLRKDIEVFLKETTLFLRGKYAEEYQIKLELKVAS